jgi:hypothetical protein
VKRALASAIVLLAACSGKVESTSEASGGSSAFGGLPTLGGGTSSGGQGGGFGGIPSGGNGGFGGGGEEFVRIGRACATDAECGSVQFCAVDNSALFDGEGPAKGYCTVDCTKGASACDRFGPNVVCVSFPSAGALCLETCTPGPAGLGQFDPDKCHGRPEVACRPLFDPSGMIIGSACFPQCNHDPDCGQELACNPKTGLCNPTIATGLPLGSPCTSGLDGGIESCAGTCTSLVSDSGLVANVCTRGCVLGVIPSCEWAGPGTGPAGNACVHPAFPSEDTGIGDQGTCGTLCDCNADCGVAALGCVPWPGPDAQALEGFYERKGYCAFLESPDAGLSCN